jgi:hypothetical protein
LSACRGQRQERSQPRREKYADLVQRPVLPLCTRPLLAGRSFG